MKHTVVVTLALVCGLARGVHVQAQMVFTKVQIGERIRKVENGRSTNRLRRKFDPTDKWMDTRTEVERVLDDARTINRVMVGGHYGTQAERYWGLLRTNINDLARAYGLTPLAA